MNLKIRNRLVLSIPLILSLCFLFASSTLLALGSQGQFPTSFANELMLRMGVDVDSYFGHLGNGWERNHEPIFFGSPNSRNRSYYLDIGHVDPQLLQLTPALNLWLPPLNLTESRNDNATNETNIYINPSYQYEDQDMNALLGLRVQEEELNLENIIILPPLSDNREGLITQLREEVERYNNDVAAGVTNPYERTILLSLNINRSHWVGIVIRLNSESGVISITYTDPAGFYGMPNHIRSSLQEVYGEDIKIEVIPGLIQRDNTGCGPLVVENLIREVRGIRGDHYVPRELMLMIRAHHVNLLENQRPDLGFKKRQQTNSRSFNDIDKNLIGTLVLSGSKGSQDYDACLKLGLTPLICGGGKNTHDKGAEQSGLHDRNKDHEDKNKDLSKATDEKAMSPNWDSLPDELKFKILDYLKPRDLSKAALVSKEWSRIANDNVLWCHKLQESFKGEEIDKALDVYKEIGYPLLTVEKGTKTTEVPNYKLVYKICGLVRSFGKKITKTRLRKERGELIEVNDMTPNFNIQKLIEDIKSPNSKAKALVIRNITISVNNAHHLANALKNENCKVVELDLEENQIGAVGAEALALALKDPNCKVTKLNLRWNDIGAAGTAALASALKNKNCEVTALNIAFNQIGAVGAAALALALKDKNCKVTKLDLEENQIGAVGTQALALALKDKNCKVTTLNLRGNRIGDAGAAALVEALENKNCKVTKPGPSYAWP